MPPTASDARPGCTRPDDHPPAAPTDLRAEARRLAHRQRRAEDAVRRLHDHPHRDRIDRLAAHSDRLCVALCRTLARLRIDDGPGLARPIARDARSAPTRAGRPPAAGGVGRGPGRAPRR
ncbi:hypothetical protein [Tautonia plasticadhaerens]|uniref:Uncharacterized protein n=1 Tax=Tautonia plasticadhaerens TaxID=2527974 RepID=A0A518HFE1_9BACT|nr:hypothetical protein [Tautonia plasticadhaerens]QDV39572.1 hypothetical protein ElP_75430 [Tautonia plasticadhaerens]